MSLYLFLGLLIASIIAVWCEDKPTDCDPVDVPIIYNAKDLYT